MAVAGATQARPGAVARWHQARARLVVAAAWPPDAGGAAASRGGAGPGSR